MTESSIAEPTPDGTDRPRPAGRPIDAAIGILDAALASFATRGYEATSLDALAEGLELTQADHPLLVPVQGRAARGGDRPERRRSVGRPRGGAGRGGEGWARVEAVVRSVFRLAARQPELLGLLREVGRLGPPAATQMTLALEPLVQRARRSWRRRWTPGTCGGTSPRLLLLAIYSTVIGMVTEVEVLRALGEEPTARSLVRRRTDVLELLRSALVTEPA